MLASVNQTKICFLISAQMLWQTPVHVSLILCIESSLQRSLF